MQKTTLPPGEYWLGDPCYVIENEDWNGFRKSVDRDTGHSTYHGHESAVFHTKYGDGNYPDRAGKYHGVDSGQIGAVARALATKCDGSLERLEELGQIIRSTKPMACIADVRGTIRLGEVTIETGDYPMNQTYSVDGKDGSLTNPKRQPKGRRSE